MESIIFLGNLKITSPTTPIIVPFKEGIFDSFVRELVHNQGMYCELIPAIFFRLELPTPISGGSDNLVPWGAWIPPPVAGCILARWYRDYRLI